MGCLFFKCSSVSPLNTDDTAPGSNLLRSNVISQAKQSQSQNSLFDQMKSDTMRDSLLDLDIARCSNYSDVRSSNTLRVPISTPQTTPVVSFTTDHTLKSVIVMYNQDRRATSGNSQTSRILKRMVLLDQSSDTNKCALSSYDNTTSFETELQFSSTQDILSEETVCGASENSNQPHSSNISAFTPQNNTVVNSTEINRFETSSVQSEESYPIFNSICSSTVSYSRDPSTDLDSDTETHASSKTDPSFQNQ